MKSRFIVLFLLSSLFLSLPLSPSEAHETVESEPVGSFGDVGPLYEYNFTVFETADFVFVKDPMGLEFRFRMGSAGYNEIWLNGSQIVADERWALQYLHGSNWKQRGIATGVTWNTGPGAAVVRRAYTDYSNTHFNISYLFMAGGPVKIRITGGIGEADTYRAVWKASGIQKGSYEVLLEKKSVKFWDTAKDEISFNYVDVFESWGNITEVEIEPWAGNHKVDLVFNLGGLKLGPLEVDPSFGYWGYVNQAADNQHWVHGSKFTCPEDGNATSMSARFYHDVASGSTSWPVKLALYYHCNSSLCAETEERNLEYSGTGYTSETFNFASNITVYKDVVYVLVSYADDVVGGDFLGLAFHTGSSGQGHKDYDTGYPTWPNPANFDHTNYEHRIQCTYTALNQAPTIGEFSCSAATIYADEWFNLNVTINDVDNNIPMGTIDFVNATVEINGTIILKWNNSTNTFSIQSDPNNYCSLNSSASIRTTANSTAYRLSWSIKLAYNYTEGNISVIATNTIVYDSYGASGSSSQSDLFYFDKKYALNLRTIDYEGNFLTEAIVYMNNGTQYNKAVNSQGWANWTDITSDSVEVYATWYRYTVNSTFTITMDEDKTIDVACKAYPFVLDGTRYWIAGNATVSSHSWNDATKKIVITFGGATDTYTLRSSAPSQPTYVLNCAFDMDNEWTTYLTLTHDASRTITIGYPNWASTRVYRTDHIITDTYWASEGEKLILTLFGTSGETGTLEIYCGSRGVPESVAGLSDTIYFSSTTILAGTYSFDSHTTVEVDWTTESSGSTGGTTTMPNIFATAENIDVGTIQQGTSKNFNATATWSGSTTITLADVTFSGTGSNWLEPNMDFPATIRRLAIETSGRISVPITIAIPREARIGDYKVLVEYRIAVGGQMYETRANILWTVTSTPIPPGGVPTIVSVVLFISLAGVVAFSIRKR
jgi:hypothetical protein